MKFIALDVETTGLDHATERIVEIGACLFDDESGKILSEFTQLVHPGRLIPPEVTAIHGITDEMVADSPEEREAFINFIQWYEQHTGMSIKPPVIAPPFVAHNAIFDQNFIVGIWNRNFRETLGMFPYQFIDTLPMARQRYARVFRSFRLESLAANLGLDTGDAHRALADARRAAKLYILMRSQAA